MNVEESVVHEAKANRFVFWSEAEAGVLEYRLAGTSMTIERTYVPPSLRGRGVAAKLVEAALVYAEASALSVVPECSYVAVYLERRASRP